jgi:glycosyltransferase involved in cell wall biosynthesis
MARLLYIVPGPVPPQADEQRERYFYLSELVEGDLLLPVWFKSAGEARKDLGERFPVCRLGRFMVHMYLNDRLPAPLRSLGRFFFFIRRGLALHRRHKYDVMVAYGTNMPGVAGALLKLLTGVKLIIEVPGAVDKAYLVVPNPGFLNRVKKRLSDIFVHISVGSADAAKLLYPTQLAAFPRLHAKPKFVFHNLVPVKTLNVPRGNQKTVLLVGYPWYVKGADILIRAFVRIAARVPDYQLVLRGHFPDRAHLEKLAQGCRQVEFMKPTSDYGEGLRTIASCGVFVLASRTEGMGRVLLEAMASERPIIASAVDGVPFYVKDNDNGLLFPAGDVEALAEKLLLVIQDRELAGRLARRGWERANMEFDEQAFVRHFQKMLETIGVPLDSRVHGQDVSGGR